MGNRRLYYSTIILREPAIFSKYLQTSIAAGLHNNNRKASCRQGIARPQAQMQRDFVIVILSVLLSVTLRNSVNTAKFMIEFIHHSVFLSFLSQMAKLPLQNYDVVTISNNVRE